MLDVNRRPIRAMAPIQPFLENKKKGKKMKSVLLLLATGSLVFASGCRNGEAQEAEVPAPVVPVELFACTYNEGRGPADLDAATAKWNAWADDRGLSDYTAWTLTKFYSGPEQEFDFIWLGVAQNAKALGRGQDDWIANGGAIQAEFDKVADCTHANYAAVNFKRPPERDDPPSNIVLSFSDCKIADGKNYGDDVVPAISAWSDFRTGHGSTAGHWVLFPVYGGGGEEFDFKWVVGHDNHEEQGADWDAYDPDKASDFNSVLDCDSSRVYNATNRRRAESDDE